MKKILYTLSLFSACILLSGAAEAPCEKNESSVSYEWKYVPSYQVISSEVDPSLDQNHARFELLFGQELLNRPDVTYPLTIEFSCNGVIRQLELDSTMKTTVDVSPGSYTFMLAVNGNPNFEEIVTDALAINPAHKTVVQFRFTTLLPITTQPDRGFVVYKPVIYTYAEKDLPVSVTVAPKGSFTYTYPEHGNGWKGTAHPDGSMTIAGKTYPYLFWEGEQTNTLDFTDYKSGFVVKRAEVTAFLEEKLTEMGLNTKEQTDFITFWGPRMAGSEQGFVQFLFNEDYDNVATLDVTPKPDNRFRVYLVWTPLPEGVVLHPKPQEIVRLNRSGFTVIEWGGTEVPWSRNEVN